MFERGLYVISSPSMIGTAEKYSHPDMRGFRFKNFLKKFQSLKFERKKSFKRGSFYKYSKWNQYDVFNSPTTDKIKGHFWSKNLWHETESASVLLFTEKTFHNLLRQLAYEVLIIQLGR